MLCLNKPILLFLLFGRLRELLPFWIPVQREYPRIALAILVNA
jgi:hypothetical protein